IEFKCATERWNKTVSRWEGRKRELANGPNSPSLPYTPARRAQLIHTADHTRILTTRHVLTQIATAQQDLFQTFSTRVLASIKSASEAIDPVGVTDAFVGEVVAAQQQDGGAQGEGEGGEREREGSASRNGVGGKMKKSLSASHLLGWFGGSEEKGGGGGERRSAEQAQAQTQAQAPGRMEKTTMTSPVVVGPGVRISDDSSVIAYGIGYGPSPVRSVLSPGGSVLSPVGSVGSGSVVSPGGRSAGVRSPGGEEEEEEEKTPVRKVIDVKLPELPTPLGGFFGSFLESGFLGGGGGAGATEGGVGVDGGGGGGGTAHTPTPPPRKSSASASHSAAAAAAASASINSVSSPPPLPTPTTRAPSHPPPQTPQTGPPTLSATLPVLIISTPETPTPNAPTPRYHPYLVRMWGDRVVFSPLPSSPSGSSGTGDVVIFVRDMSIIEQKRGAGRGFGASGEGRGKEWEFVIGVRDGREVCVRFEGEDELW
ncbi:hypothetical protein HDV00_009081, partial [Rhizophlyctis rosea]